MSDTEEEKMFEIETAKNGRAGCKKCKQKCQQGDLRIAKIVPNPFGDGKMKNWHHVDCLFDGFKKQRATTKRIESESDIIGLDALLDSDKELIREKINELHKFFGTTKKSPAKRKGKLVETTKQTKNSQNNGKGVQQVKSYKDDLFQTFQDLVNKVSKHPSYLDKTAIVKQMFEKGSSGTGFEGDPEIWCRLLLPGSVKRIYNLQSKQLVKLFSRIFNEDQTEMLEHLQQGDISETISHFYKESLKMKPIPLTSTITVQQVDTFLEHLSKLSKEEDQMNHFQTILKILTSEDLKTIIRLIKHDLRMGAGPKHILEGIHPDAYDVYKASKDLDGVVERVQVHKHGKEFKYFSRSLKPVLPHKVSHFKDYIPKAFPHGNDLILDTEILMMDTATGKPLPFGTLGVHKKAQFKDATVCLFVFDCIYYNGESLINKPLKERKQILHDNMIEVQNHIVFSEMKEIDEPKTLAKMIAKVLKLGLEGLVLKDTMSKYEPGKRHWLKVKKDYLFGGAMADSADLIVLGAWYGTGQKGGMMSVFLMGSYNPASKKFCTVTKVHTGHDDKTLDMLQKELKMEKINCDPDKVPSWLNCTRTMVPDFVAKDPKKQPVWEITGAEFTQHNVHTAHGISIRFPRVTKIREDKTWETATNTDELKILFEKSKEDTDVSLLLKDFQGKMKDTDEIMTEEKPLSKKKRVSDGSNSFSDSSPSKKLKVHDRDTFLSEGTSKKRKVKKDSEKLSTKDTKGNKIKSEDHDIAKRKVKLINPLQELFKGLKTTFIVQENTEIERYFIAYGGTVLKAPNLKEVTHIFHFHKKIKHIRPDWPKTAKHVHIGWIVDSVNNMRLVSTDKYVINWKSSFEQDEHIDKICNA
ncbi:DNA ligase 3 isoform X2 [Sitophilus oryzae]|uniref:DNA ligase 3 n=1 Tax=Sitophilus oryzae TaxID=7048 RepID=A0A6J2YFT5_SITOR|nr:DNA ligase 3 isoform X2 [Sitophilus oryzae]